MKKIILICCLLAGINAANAFKVVTQTAQGNVVYESTEIDRLVFSPAGGCDVQLLGGGTVSINAADFRGVGFDENYVAPPVEVTKVEFVDAVPYTSTEGYENVDVVYTRTFTSNSWQALYIPFNMSYDEWCDYADVAEINGVHQFDVDEDGSYDGPNDKTLLEFRTVKSGELRPNTPYVIRPKVTGQVQFICSGKTVTPAPAENGKVWCATSRLKYTLTGVYEYTNITNCYALNKGIFYRATATSPDLQPNRIFLSIQYVDNGYGVPYYAIPERINIQVDDEVSGIENVSVAPAMDDAYYDMLGRRVENPSNGIYIHNGKKVYVK